MLDAYRNETEHLNAERIPLAAGLFLLCVGGTGVCEYLFHREHFEVWLIFYSLEALVCLPLVVLRGVLLERGWLRAFNIGAWLLLSLLLHAYAVATLTPAELLALGTACLMAGTSLLLPWGIWGQSILCAGSLLCFALAIQLGVPFSIHPVYLTFALGNAAAISILGARHLDLHRFALFREATLREEEVSLSRSLVAIAQEINGSLDAHDVLDRITEAIRGALGCGWTSILLRNDQRNVFRLASSSGRTPAALRELQGIEFGAGAFPLIGRVLREHDVEIGNLADADAPTATFMRNWRCHSLLAARLTRGGEAVGILVAAMSADRGGFSERARRLFRGIAQHAAIAVNNVRLINELRDADRMKSEFLSTMSHELRTPLNVIIGYSDLVLDGAFGAMEGEQQQVLTRVSENAHSLLELITSTLEVNRIESGRARLQLREITLRHLVVELQHDTAHLPRHAGVGLYWEGPGQDATVRCDSSKLKIVVKNLVGNALKFTRRGRVVVHLAYDRRAASINVQVHDTGTGIPPDDLPHIFTMFRQGDSDHPHGGVGLGLYIVRRFVEQLGGRVSVSSSLGEGSTFRVSIPAVAVVAHELPAETVRKELVA